MKIMKYITFATTNQRKINEAKAALADFGITVETKGLEIDEIQSHDPVKIAKFKAAEAFRLTGAPVVITDTSWEFRALNGFPGGYMKDVASWLKPTDFINLLKDYEDKTVSFIESIVYQDEKQTKIFSQKYDGLCADKPRGEGNSIEQVAEFDGFTIAERHDQGGFSHDPKEYIWYQFANWYSKLEK